MDRRKFFQNLIGASAAAAIGPKVFSQIVEQEYTVPDYRDGGKIPGKDITPPPTDPPFGGSGLWVFKDEKMIAYGTSMGVTISIDRPIFNIETDSPWETFIPGIPEGSWHVEDFHVIDDSAFHNNDVVHVILKTPEGHTIESDAIFKTISYAGAASNSWIRTTADFAIVGEMTMYYD